MDALARREYGQRELIDKMVRAGFEPAVAEDCLTTLTAENLQSDERFCEAFVQSYARRGKGPVRVVHDLSAKVVAEHLVHEAMAGVTVDWFELAAEVRQQKFGRGLPEDFKEKARQMRFLQYRGFTNEQITVACSRTREPRQYD